MINEQVEQTHQKIILKVRYHKEEDNSEKIGVKKLTPFKLIPAGITMMEACMIQMKVLMIKWK